MPYEVLLDPRAVSDIQQAIDYYEDQRLGLGKAFEMTIDEKINSLTINPFFGIRYDYVRCLPIEKFPFMLHFSLNEEKQMVIIHAVIHTSRNPKIWVKKD